MGLNLSDFWFYLSRYVKISTETEDTEGSIHCCKDQNINGNGPNGIHEEGSPSKTFLLNCENSSLRLLPQKSREDGD